MPSLRFDTDWLAVDAKGHVALFFAGMHGAIPGDAEPRATTDALEALMRATEARQAGAGYRAASVIAAEPIFDPPCASGGDPLHERLLGYPHLVCAEDAVALHAWLLEYEVREVVVTRGAGVIVSPLGEFTWEMLHDADAPVCIGCRATVNLDDPPPRAPEVVARAGLFVYAHDGTDDRSPYVRVVSPAIPADLADLEPIVVGVAERVPFAVDFADHETFSPWRYVGCR